jgi:hypothetical protein
VIVLTMITSILFFVMAASAGLEQLLSPDA